MDKSRRTKAVVIYNGRDISEYVTDFSYTDNTDKTDDVSVKLADREDRWLDEWFPQTGDRVSCTIQVFDWNSTGDNRSLDLGTFEVDNVDFSETVTMNAVSVPITSDCRSEKKSRAWEDISLNSIASDIAGNGGLSLVYETSTDPFYDRQDQNDKSDLEFLEQLCKSDGLCMKVTDSKLIIFSEMEYDAKEAVNTVIRGTTDIIGKPKFKRNAKNIYKACEINYFDSKTDKNYTGTFEAPDVDTGHTLKLREKFNSESDDINFERKSKARLREQNKNEWTADVTLKGDVIYSAGTNINFEGWYKFDGKYSIKTCSHSIGSSGYTVSLSTARCLEGY